MRSSKLALLATASLVVISCADTDTEISTRSANPAEESPVSDKEVAGSQLAETAAKPASSPCGRSATSPGGIDLCSVWEFGPGGGGRMEGPAIYPFNRNILFLGSDMRTFARSPNQGRSWSMLDARMISTIKARFKSPYAFGPKQNDHIYVTTLHGLFKSSDIGFTWSKVEGSWMNAGVSAGPDIIAAGPTWSGLIVAGFDADKSGGQAQLYKTFNANEKPTWQKLSVPAECSIFRRVLFPSPGKFESWQMMVACKEGIFFHDGGGLERGPKSTHKNHWTKLSHGLPIQDIIDADFGVGADGRTQLFVLTQCGEPGCSPVYISRNLGLSWERSGVTGFGIEANAPLSYLRDYQQIAVGRQKNGKLQVYVTQTETSVRLTHGRATPKPDDEGSGQIYVSKDEGRTWQPTLFRHPDQRPIAAKSNGEPATFGYNMVHKGWRTIGEWGYRHGPDGIAILRDDPDIVFIGDLISNNGGRTWLSTDSRGFLPSEPGTKLQVPRVGFPVMGAVDYFFHPTKPDVHIIAMEDFGGWRTINSNRSWENTTQHDGVGYSDKNGPRNPIAYDYDPRTDRVWLAGSEGHNLPHWSEIGAAFTNNPNRKPYSGFVGYSEDNGESWIQVGSQKQEEGGLPYGPASSVVVDRSVATQTRIGVALLKHGYFWSEDDGKTWLKESANLENSGLYRDGFPYKLGIDPHGRYYALNIVRPAGFSFSGGNLFIMDYGNKTWQSGSASWRAVGQRTDIPYPVNVTFHPKDKKVIYLSAFSTPTGLHKAPVVGGLWRTKDEGATWARAGGESMRRSVFDVTIHPTNHFCMVASVLDSGLHVSFDGGENWKLVKNFPPNHPYKLRWDLRPNQANRLVVTSFGQGLWNLSIPCVQAR
jgi:hypothetical protein